MDKPSETLCYSVLGHFEQPMSKGQVITIFQLKIKLFGGQLCLRSGAFRSEAGYERGEVSNQQAIGIKGSGCRLLALSAF